MTLAFEEHPFWDYSIGLYGTRGVSAACLALQDRHEIDVNVLLYCSWVGHSGRGVLTPAQLSAVLEAVDQWHRNVVRALRAVRQSLKGGIPPAPIAQSDALRNRILKTEVDCEHAEQLMLAHAVELSPDAGLPVDQRAEDAVANIGGYFLSSGDICDAADKRRLAIILGAAFPGLDDKRIAALSRAIMPAGTGAG